jgi:thiamine-phosphate pyrophosphorylase
VLCLVLDRKATRGDLLHAVSAAVSAGVDRVQLRERHLEDGALLELADAVSRSAREAAARAGRRVEVVVNRRVDVALACGADGVHLGFDALPAEQARELLGPHALLGVSCHSSAEVAAARGVDYAQLAPIFPPLSKPSTQPALGTEAMTRSGTSLPVLAQGGIDADNAAACIAAGAAGVAVTGSVLAAADPAAAAARLRLALDTAARRAGPATLSEGAGRGSGGS